MKQKQVCFPFSFFDLDYESKVYVFHTADEKSTSIADEKVEERIKKKGDESHVVS